MIWFAFVLFGVIVYIGIKIAEELHRPCPRIDMGYNCRGEKCVCHPTHKDYDPNYEKPDEYER